MSPPTTVTCATPPVDNSRGLKVQSASVRSSSSDVLSAVSPTTITSPNNDDCGANTGASAPAGNCSPIPASFSATICRAR